MNKVTISFKNNDKVITNTDQTKEEILDEVNLAKSRGGDVLVGGFIFDVNDYWSIKIEEGVDL